MKIEYIKVSKSITRMVCNSKLNSNLPLIKACSTADTYIGHHKHLLNIKIYALIFTWNKYLKIYVCMYVWLHITSIF